MQDSRFTRWRRERTARGQGGLADTIRHLLYRTDATLFDTLDFSDDDAFLDPLLFAWFTADVSRRMPLQQAVADTVFWSGLPTLGGHILLDRFLQDAVGLLAVDADWNQIFRNSLTLIAAHCPAIAEELARFIRRVVLFRADAPNSFAALSAHGAIFLNVPPDATELFFLEEIAHQGAHVLFNAMTAADKPRYLLLPPDTKLNSLTGDAGDERTIYTVFHALFTYTLICDVLTAMRTADVFQGHRQHELHGRIGYVLGRFGLDLALLDRPGLFAARGQLCFQRFAAHRRAMIARHADIACRFDYRNQPYNFDYGAFLARNPRPNSVRRRAAA